MMQPNGGQKVNVQNYDHNFFQKINKELTKNSRKYLTWSE